jgi:hypothetical protein
MIFVDQRDESVHRRGLAHCTLHNMDTTPFAFVGPSLYERSWGQRCPLLEGLQRHFRRFVPTNSDTISL